MRIIGLTGSIACGKSTVSKLLHQHGIPIIDTDLLAHALAEPGAPLYEAYLAHWGKQVLAPDGTLDRHAIWGIISQDTTERDWVDQAAHPIIQNEAMRELARLKAQGEAIVVLDVPLLFEAGWDKFATETWVVSLPEDVELARLMARDQINETEARARIAAQMPLAEKRERANVVLDNSGTRKELRKQVEKALSASPANGGGAPKGRRGSLGQVAPARIK